ncbi:MAG: hypothetical protein GY765_17640 [bacterium]|nr:hypothetical protein [bacterium]
MKEFFVGILIFVLSVPFVSAGEKENPMASFMGQKWGVDAMVFMDTFTYKDKLKMRGGGAFELVDFMLGDVTLNLVRFNFVLKTNGQKVRFEEKNLDKFVLESVEIFDMRFSDFVDLVDIFKMKYGTPAKDRTNEERYLHSWRRKNIEAIWVDKTIKRKIVMDGSMYTKPSKDDYIRIVLEKITPAPDPELERKQREKMKKEATSVL